MADHETAIAAINQIAESGEIARARAVSEQLQAKIQQGSTAHKALVRHYALMLLAYFADPDGARAVVEERLADDPRDAEALGVLARIEAVAGRAEPAIAAARRLMALNPRDPLAYQTLVGLTPEEGPRLAPKIESLLADARTGAHARKMLLGDLGRIRDRQGDHARAFEAFLSANAIGDPGYDPEIAERFLAEAQMVFTPDFFAAREAHGLDDARMVFIVGLPRSGTTLLEQLLAAHPQVEGLGERDAIKQFNGLVQQQATKAGLLPSGRFAYAHLAFLGDADSKGLAQRYLDTALAGGERPRQRIWIDKLPGNYLHLGLIRLLFPKATILWADRDPRDVGLSCFQANFESGHGYARRPERLAHMLPVALEKRRFWGDLFGGWIHPVSYEALVRDPKAVLSDVFARLGLDWRDETLDRAGRKGTIQTASVFQAREAIHGRSIGRWRNYAEPFGATIEALAAYDRLRAEDAEQAA